MVQGNDDYFAVLGTGTWWGTVPQDDHHDWLTTNKGSNLISNNAQCEAVDLMHCEQAGER